MFLEEQFPLVIAYGSQGGPSFSTRIVASASGYEDRNANWQAARHTYDAASGMKTEAQLDQLIEFFHAVQGSAHGFRWKDYLDYKSCAVNADPAFDDQVIGVADGQTTTFQLKKTYTRGALSTERIITKPVSGTVLIGVGGTQQSSGWSVDTTTGLVTFDVAPASGNVTWGGEHDVPVRFATDSLSISLDDYKAGRCSIPVIEIRV